MTRPSPQTNRVVALIETLAARPDETLTLAEATRRLDVNKSTCLSMLQALTAAGWLLRDPYRKTYRLGPGLVGIGAAASAGFPALEFARPAMVELSRWAMAHCVAFAVESDHVSVVDQVRNIRATGRPIGQGHIPLRPPFGTVVIAAGDDEAVQHWLDLADPADRPSYQSAIARVRQRGYAIELVAEGVHVADREPLPQMVERLSRQMSPHVLLNKCDREKSYEISAINAAVRGPGDTPVLILSLMGFGAPLSGKDVELAGARLIAAAKTVSDALRD